MSTSNFDSRKVGTNPENLQKRIAELIKQGLSDDELIAQLYYDYIGGELRYEHVWYKIIGYTQTCKESTGDTLPGFVISSGHSFGWRLPDTYFNERCRSSIFVPEGAAQGNYNLWIVSLAKVMDMRILTNDNYELF